MRTREPSASSCVVESIAPGSVIPNLPAILLEVTYRGCRHPRAASRICTGFGSASAQTANFLEAPAELVLVAALGELEEALSGRLLRHQLLRRHALRAVVRIVVAGAASERLRRR